MNTMLKMSAVAMVMMGAMQMAQAAAPTAKPLTLNVKGVITALTCDLSADVSANTVDLGIAFPSQFGAAAGTPVGKKTFHLQTLNCQQDGTLATAAVANAGDLVASVDFGADEVVTGNGQWYDLAGPKDAAIVVEGPKLDATAHTGVKGVLTAGDKIFIASAAAADVVNTLDGKKAALEAYMVSLTAANPVAQTLSVPVTFTAMYQ